MKYTITVNVDLQYEVRASTPAKAREKVENMELPKEYVEDTFDITRIVSETGTEF